MIIQALLDLVYGVFYLLTTPINIPSLPDGVTSAIQTAVDYMASGAGLIANWTHLPYLLTLLGLVLAVDVGVMLYNFVMFILRKIPFFGIK